MHGYDAGMVGDMAGILGPASTYAANANAPSPFAIYLAEDESLQAGNQQDQEPDALMDAVLRLFSLDESDPLANGGEEDEDEDVVVDLEDQQLRTDRLRGITLSLDQLWWSGQVYMAAAAEKLADGSRDCTLYPLQVKTMPRCVLGPSDLPGAFQLPKMIVLVHTLTYSHRPLEDTNGKLWPAGRLLDDSGYGRNSKFPHDSCFTVNRKHVCGYRYVTPTPPNFSADTYLQDENRARVVSRGSLKAIIALLKDKSLVPFVVPVLFNICFDYGM